MKRKVVGVRRDEGGDWILVLECGHVQHSRHQSLSDARKWILSDMTRRHREGLLINCSACDAFASGEAQ